MTLVLALLALTEPLVAQAQPGEEAVTRPILGFVALLALAHLAGRPGLARFEKKLALNPLVTTGLVFVLLGWLAASGHVKILTESVIKAIAPIVPLGSDGLVSELGSIMTADSWRTRLRALAFWQPPCCR